MVNLLDLSLVGGLLLLLCSTRLMFLEDEPVDISG